MRRIFTALCLCFLCSPLLQAQFLVNNGAVIHIEGMHVMVMGGAYNNGEISNNGALEVQGGWTNDSTYSGTGKLILSGTGSQVFEHNDQEIAVLKIESTGGEIILQSDLSIKDSLILENVIITPMPDVRLVLEDNAIITGGSDNSHINGPLYHRGTGTKLYPVGKNGIYAPVILDNIEGTFPVVGVEAFIPNPNPRGDLTTSRVSYARAWSLDVLNGTYDGSQITLFFDERDSVSDIEKVLVTKADSADGYFTSIGRYKFTGDVTSGSVTSEESAIARFYAIGEESEIQQFFIPAAMSPGAPSPEDAAMKIYSIDVEEEEAFELKVFNKWGNVVFETTSYTEASTTGWDGRDRSGKMLDAGVYTYTVKGKFKSGRPFNSTGTVTLIKT